MTDKPRYILPLDLWAMSHNEREDYMDALVEADMNDGPQWDALYSMWATINGED